LRRFGLFLIHLQSKNKATLGNASNSRPKDSVTQASNSRQASNSTRKLAIQEMLAIQDQKTL